MANEDQSAGAKSKELRAETELNPVNTTLAPVDLSSIWSLR